MSTSVLADLPHLLRSRDPSVEQRRAPRDLVDMISHATARGRTHGVCIINISPLGLMCRTDAELPVGERISIWLPVLLEVAAEVRWTEGGRVGMEFLTAIDPACYAAMLALMPPRRTLW